VRYRHRHRLLHADGQRLFDVPRDAVLEVYHDPWHSQKMSLEKVRSPMNPPTTSHIRFETPGTSALPRVSKARGEADDYAPRPAAQDRLFRSRTHHTSFRSCMAARESTGHRDSA
jgi:hypothetical protein